MTWRLLALIAVEVCVAHALRQLQHDEARAHVRAYAKAMATGAHDDARAMWCEINTLHVVRRDALARARRLLFGP